MTTFKNKSVESLFSEDELVAIETANPDGMSNHGVCAKCHGWNSTEPGVYDETWRGDHGDGLIEIPDLNVTMAVPDTVTRWVGSKGKHKGSKGIYPVGVVRQINEIKLMMGQDYTIDDIRRHFVFVGGEIEELRNLLGRIFGRLEESFASDEEGAFSIAGLHREIVEAENDAKALLAKIEEMSGRLRDLKRAAREAV